ncbi:MAG: PEP-CTERM sorting domain-containing protein [Planctomycetota bacterium]
MKAHVTVVAMVLLATGQGFANVYFNDGATHNVTSFITQVYVDSDAPGMHTTVNLLDGGSIWKWWAYEDSRIDISGGSADRGLSAYDRTQVTMSAGQIWYLWAYGHSQTMISGGTATGDLCAEDSSQLTLSGGSVEGYVVAGGNSIVIMTGGAVSGLLGAGGSSQVTILGGTISQTLDMYQDAIVYLHGDQFAIDGIPLSSGAIRSVLGTSCDSEPFRRLTGTLASGDIVNNLFRIGDSAQLVLVPEPATLSLLALGGLAVLCRKRK